MKYSIVVVLLLFLTIPRLAYAQKMSDEQVVNYIKQEKDKGTTQNEIATNLFKMGVNKAQLERIKRQYDQGNETSQQSKISSREIRENPAETSTRFNYPSTDKQTDDEEKNKKQIFGHNIFNNQNLTFEPETNIPTPLNYKLGPGDEVIIDVWGVSEATIKQVISAEGSITIQHLGPVYLNGMSIKEANDYIQNKFGNVFAGVGSDNSQIKLTLGQIRTIQINVMGEVVVPGTYSVSSLASVFHVLYKAGGVNDIGTLRSVKLYRGGKLLQTMDIYKYILEGKLNNDIRIADGDVIIVSPYNTLVNISGNVKRPMFYEMTNNESVSDLITYAGGLKGDAYTKSVRLIRQTGEQTKIFTIDKNQYSTFKLVDGDSITISSGLDQFENRVEIKGAVYREGMYEISDKLSTVKQLIEKSDGLRGDAFLNRAVVIREKDDLSTETISIDIRSLMSGNSSDIPLRKNDIVIIPSINDLNETKEVTIHGEIPRPGNYKFSQNTTLEDIILQAGGLLESASVVRIDVARRIKDPKSTTSNQTISKTFTFSLKDGFIVDGEKEFVLEAFDQIYVRRNPGYYTQQNIYTEGEVLFPGTYALNKKTERVSDIIKRAGGITSDAYPEGAKLLRIRNEEERARAESVLKMASKGSNDSISVKSLDISPVYSVGINLEKAIDFPGSDYDLVLREGDKLIIPEYNNTVKINGAVMYPNTVVFKKGKKLSYYINEAGGFGDNANKGKSYIIYANGTVSQGGKSSKMIQPGCEIVVPTKEPKRKLSVTEIVSLTSAVVSMSAVVGLLINATKSK